MTTAARRRAPEARPRATYQDVLDTPIHQVAEIVDGVLYATPRPAMPHALASSLLGSQLIAPFHLGRGGPGGWWIIDEPELHHGDDILVPDLAGWRRTRMPSYPETAYTTLVPDWVCEILSPACIAYHDEHVRGVSAKRIQVDEIWQFCYAKQRTVETAKAAPEGAGDTWTWTALDADSKLIVSWLLGQRDGIAAYTFMHDLALRLTGRVQLTSDLYEGAIEDAFGADIDYAQLIKVFGDTRETSVRYSPGQCKGAVRHTVQGDPDLAHVNTAYVERHNLTMRMSMRRFTRLTNAFSKKFNNHMYALALYFVHYNFCRIHKTLRMSPAMAAGVTDTLRDAEWIVGLVDANAPTPAKPGPKGPRKPKSN